MGQTLEGSPVTFHEYLVHVQLTYVVISSATKILYELFRKPREMRAAEYDMTAPKNNWTPEVNLASYFCWCGTRSESPWPVWPINQEVRDGM
jgi:hypothetical protein